MSELVSIRPGKMREERLLALRREAEQNGRVHGAGVRPGGSPFPVASPQTGYYGQPLLKEPQWTWMVPLYFFVGGATGSLGVIGSLADLAGHEKDLARNARTLATFGAVVSSVLLVADLGRPSRFLNMLRVFKPQSTMSMGSWILSAFSLSATASMFADVLHWRFGSTLAGRLIGGIGRVGSTLFGMPFHNYTGVLLATTAIPVWNARVKSLPRVFGMSGLQSAVGLLELAGHADSRALNLLGLFSAAAEVLDRREVEQSGSRALAPLKEGASGAMLRAAAILSGSLPLILRLAASLPGDHRRLRRAAAVAGIAGSILTRYGWTQAGSASARDWRLPLAIEAPAEPAALTAQST